MATRACRSWWSVGSTSPRGRRRIAGRGAPHCVSGPATTARASACARWRCGAKLANYVVVDWYKGMPVVVVARLYQSTWTAKDSGEKRSALRIRASHVGAAMGLRRVTVTREEPVGNKRQSDQDGADAASSQAEGAAAEDAAQGSENEERELVGAAAPPF